MKRIYPKAFTLARVRALVEQELFAVPELQREFVWTSKKACELLDSVYRRYPIGTLLVWKTTKRNETQLRSQLHILPQFNPANDQIWFLIDGQQRLSVLWNFVKGQASAVENADGRRVDFGKVYFDSRATGDESLFLSRARLSAAEERSLVPVVDLLARNWQSRTRQYGKRTQKRIANCRERLLAYKVLFVFCETDERSEVRDTFVRVNSLGMKIGAADRAFARASKIRMRGLVNDLQTRLNNGFGDVKRTTILQTTALALGSRDLGERAIDRMVSDIEGNSGSHAEFTAAWPRLREAFCTAADYFVKTLGVPNFGFLPSEPMLTILALYFFHKGKGRPPRAAQIRLQHWFWATGVGARYTGRGYRPNLLADAEFAKRLASNPNAKLTGLSLSPAHVLRGVDYSRPGPVSNAFFCLLRQHRPRYLEDATEIPLGEISSRSNRSDKHHVFPTAFLSRSGIPPERGNSILNICYLVAQENQGIGSKPPRRYLDELPRSVATRNRALRSHLLPTSDQSGLWKSHAKMGFKRFLDERETILKREFCRTAGAKLFEGA